MTTEEKAELTPYQQIELKLKAHTDEVAALIDGAGLGDSKSLSVRFAEAALMDLTRNPKLVACQPWSIVVAVKQAALLGLPVGATMGQAYMVPYGDVASFQVGYRGLTTLATRCGAVRKVQSFVVSRREYDSGRVKVKHGTNHEYTFEPDLLISDKERDETCVGVFTYVLTPSGDELVEWIPVDELNRIQRKASQYSPAWNEFRSEMRAKTGTKRALKKMALQVSERSLPLYQAIAHDNEERGPMAEQFEKIEVMENPKGVVIDTSAKPKDEAETIESVVGKVKDVADGSEKKYD